MDLLYTRIQFCKELTFVLVDTFGETVDIWSEIQHLNVIVKLNNKSSSRECIETV